MIKERLNDKVDVPFGYSHIYNGLVSFAAHIEKSVQHIINRCPVFFIQSGDSQYVMDTKFNRIDNKELYETIPRLVLKLDGINRNREMDTNKYNKYVYKHGDEVYECKARRLQMDFDIKCTMISSNFITALQNFEVLASIFAHENVLTYPYAGSMFEGKYYLDSDDTLEPPDIDDTQINVRQDIPVILELHVWSPVHSTIEISEPTTQIGVILTNDEKTIGFNIDRVKDVFIDPLKYPEDLKK